MMHGGWTDANSIRYILTEQRCEHSVSEERGVANSVDPLWIHHHGYHLPKRKRERERERYE